jgi:cytochrome c-type biogenesis protein CcmH
MAFRLAAVVLAILAGLAVAVGGASAQDGTTDPTADDVNRVAKQLYCPVCPNTPLDVCETQACKDWRAQIRDFQAQGWTDDQVIEYFVAQYGERVLAEPRRQGFTSFVWVLPLVSVLIGLALLAQVLRGWKRRRAKPLVAEIALDPNIPADLRARLEQELREIA